jgi:flavin reductase (DIM6/NTAB) family NADH-FMN oxidoreductase RutF
MRPMQSFAADSAETYKAIARTWAATVTVVTTRRAGADGAAELDGFTATAFLTVSIAPPIVVVSATRAATAFTMLRDASSFVVNLLAANQQDIANAFAKPAADRVGIWDRTPWSGDAEGAPLLNGAIGAFSARVRQLVDAGDHVLVLGDVTALHLGDGADTLVHHNRAYGRVTPI